MEFFAVTRTSLYSVTDQKDDSGFPIVEKIALRNESHVPVGGRLENGRLVGIASYGLVMYDEDHPRGYSQPHQDPEEVNIAFWGGHTSPIVALFLRKDEAVECFDSSNLRMGDSRWRKQTEEVLQLIGDNHPVFIISRSKPIRFEKN